MEAKPGLQSQTVELALAALAEAAAVAASSDVTRRAKKNLVAI